MRVPSTPTLLMAGLSVSSAAFAAPTGYGKGNEYPKSPDPAHSESSPLLGGDSPRFTGSELKDAKLPGFRQRDPAYSALGKRQLPSTQSVTGLAQGLPINAGSITNSGALEYTQGLPVNAGSLQNSGALRYAQGLPINAGTITSAGTLGSIQAGGAAGLLGSASGLTQGGLTPDLEAAASNGLGLGNLLPPVVSGTVGGLLGDVEGLLPLSSITGMANGVPVVGSLPLSSIASSIESPMNTPEALTSSATGYLNAVPLSNGAPSLSSVQSLNGSAGLASVMGVVPQAASGGIATIQNIGQQVTGQVGQAAASVPIAGGAVGSLAGQAMSVEAAVASVTNALSPSTIPTASILSQVIAAASSYPAVVAALQSAASLPAASAIPSAIPTSVAGIVASAQAMATGASIPSAIPTISGVPAVSSVPAVSALPISMVTMIPSGIPASVIPSAIPSSIVPSGIPSSIISSAVPTSIVSALPTTSELPSTSVQGESV